MSLCRHHTHFTTIEIAIRVPSRGHIPVTRLRPASHLASMACGHVLLQSSHEDDQQPRRVVDPLLPFCHVLWFALVESSAVRPSGAAQTPATANAHKARSSRMGKTLTRSGMNSRFCGSAGEGCYRVVAIAANMTAMPSRANVA
jgi:hypothetical protein